MVIPRNCKNGTILCVQNGNVCFLFALQLVPCTSLGASLCGFNPGTASMPLVPPEPLYFGSIRWDRSLIPTILILLRGPAAGPQDVQLQPFFPNPPFSFVFLIYSLALILFENNYLQLSLALGSS